MAEPPPRDPDDPRVDPADETVVEDRGTDTETYVEEDEVVPRRRRAPLLWPWLLLLLLLVLGGLGAYWYFTQEDENTVPAVVGMTQDRAEAELREAKFEPEARREDDAKPRDVVISQSPQPGTELEEGEQVAIVVSNGPPRETVPDVVGERLDEAVSNVEAAGFDAKVTQVFSDKPVGVVVNQSPEQGTNAKEGSTVELAVSKGGKPVVVPDVVGTTSAQATETLRKAGLEVNLFSVPSDQPAGTVVAQKPTAGATSKQGTTVRLNVAKEGVETTTTTTTTVTTPTTSTGAIGTPQPPTTNAKGTVPDVVGSELADAARQFGDEGLRVDVRYVPSAEPQGRVVAQARPAGTQLNRGQAVLLNVSNGPNPKPATSVPSTSGLTRNDARERLSAAGFEVLAIERDVSGTPDAVLSQSPSAGASIPRGSLVIVYVVG